MATEHSLQDVFPLLPLRGLLVYPAMVLHFDVGRDKSIKALEKAMISEHLIVLASQEDGQMDEPAQEDLYHIGTLARVKQMMKLPNGTIRVLVEGLERAKIEEFTRREDWFEVRIHRFAEDDSLEVSAELQAMMRSLLQQFEQYVKLSKKVDQETYASVTDIDQPGRLADLVASHLPLKIKDKQDILEALDVRQRMEKVLQVLSDEREVLELERKIHQRVRKQMERTQKEYYLREQMKAIQKELGDREGRTAEIEELRNLMNEKSLPDAVSERVEREIDRLERIPAASAEGTVSRTYIDWLLALPCTESTESKVDLKKAERILDEEHYGLEKVKERILEFLAVQQLASRQMGPIICLAGPPGVGKTSLAKSIARSLNRPFVRVSLGGVRDEAEIRGHRRTYIGALPGRILQGMKQAGKRNPVFLLDEIDKMANDFRGDPSSALLEVLDPEQNSSFSDHYVELPFDLSDVLFITTANNVYQIPGPLRDRMEVIHLAGYTELEKLQIARSHLFPKQRDNHALKGD
ncbi:MAG: endopeptidase La, partial [Alicyclobacillus sp. RIFOXYA1_FULL_53_8]